MVEGQGHGHGQGHIKRRLRTLCGLVVGPICGIPLYKCVVGGVKGDCRNILHDVLYVVSFKQYLNTEQQFQASLVVWRFVSTGAKLKWDNFYICACDVWDEVGIFLSFSCVSVQNIRRVLEWKGEGVGVYCPNYDIRKHVL